jgi:hypothetical protein
MYKYLHKTILACAAEHGIDEVRDMTDEGFLAASQCATEQTNLLTYVRRTRENVAIFQGIREVSLSSTRTATVIFYHKDNFFFSTHRRVEIDIHRCIPVSNADTSGECFSECFVCNHELPKEVLVNAFRCDHLMCKLCVGEWCSKASENNNTCPMCRASMLKTTTKTSKKKKNKHKNTKRVAEVQTIDTRSEITKHMMSCLQNIKQYKNGNQNEKATTALLQQHVSIMGRLLNVS